MQTTASHSRTTSTSTRVAVTAIAATALIGMGLVNNARPVHAATKSGSDAVVRITAGGERIASIRTARGVTTMLSLPAEAREAVCGDLFDAQSGNGCFVIQRSGRDLFLKPLKATGETNLFVKTDAATYAFDLTVVPAPRAMRIVFVDTAAPDRAIVAAREQLARDRAALDADCEQLLKERASAGAELDRQRAAIDEESNARAETIARRWLADGAARAIPIVRRNARGRDGLEITLGEAALRIGDRTMLQCTIRNRGDTPIVVALGELSGSPRRTSPINTVAPVSGDVSVVLAFDGVPGTGCELRLLDTSGRELVAVKAFR